MTQNQYKQIIKSVSRKEIEEHLFELFKSSKAFKEIEIDFWSRESDDKLLDGMKKQFKDVFWRDKLSMRECKKVLNGYLNRTGDGGTKALMYLAFAAEAIERNIIDYCDYGESFYESIFEAAEKFLDYAKTDRAFYELHQEEFDNFLTRSESTRACIADSLGELEGDVMLELGYFDEEEEDSEDEGDEY